MDAYGAFDDALKFLGGDNEGWAVGGALFVTGILASSVATDVESLGTYFTNWSLLVQLAAFISFIRRADRHVWLQELATVLVWTVAISFSIVTAASNRLRDDLYALYGPVGFWVGNIVIHYLPLLFNYAAFYHTSRGKEDSSGKRTSTTLGGALAVCLGAVGLLVTYSFTHSTQKVYHNDLDEFNGSFWMGILAIILIFLVTRGREIADASL